MNLSPNSSPIFIFLTRCETKGSTLKVFIADDSELIHERLSMMLSELPEVEIVGRATDGQTAIRLINKQCPDVVVLDIRMPKQNGMDVLQSIKKNGAIPLVIIFTNFPYPQYREKCAQLGADFFFDKSSEFHELKNIFHNLIHNAKN